MPRPWTVIRWLAALYTGVMGAVLLWVFIYERVTQQGTFIGGGVRHPMDTADAVSLGLWLISTVITGWCGMGDIASASSDQQ